MTDMSERLDEEQPQVEGWKPVEGDKLIGRIVRIDTRTGGEYQPYPVVVIQPNEGEPVAFHAYHTVAQNLLEEQSARVGDEIGVYYLGKKQGATNAYHNYRIIIDHGPSDEELESIAQTQRAQKQERDTRDESIPF